MRPPTGPPESRGPDSAGGQGSAGGRDFAGAPAAGRARSRLSPILAALRIACRDAVRAKARSALAIAMIALPVTAVSGWAVFLRTDDISVAESMPGLVGRADALVIAVRHGPVVQSLDPGLVSDPKGYPVEADPRSWTGVQVRAMLGPGARAVPTTAGGIFYRTDRGAAIGEARELDLRDPLTAGLVRLRSGRVPGSPDEVLVSPAMAQGGLGVGSVIKVGRGERPVRIVGIGERAIPSATERLIVGLPGTLLGAAPREAGWLVDTPRPVTWSEIKRLNAVGLAALSPAVVCGSPGPAATKGFNHEVDNSADPAMTVTTALAVTMIVLEVVLLAGPAFAVGIRRQRRHLALVAAAGGSRRQVRDIVLAGGVVLGGIAAGLGVPAGLGLGALLRRVAYEFGSTYGPYEVPWDQVGMVAALGVGSGLLAAYVPARRAARMDVVAALAGRRDRIRPRNGWPIAGGVLAVAGVAATVAGSMMWQSPGTAVGAALLIIGLVAATPWIVSQVGRVAPGLPVPLRLAIRDAVRNRGRTAPVVSAVMAAVAGLTALGIGYTAELAQQRRGYQPRAPLGTVYAEGAGTSPAFWQSVAATMARELPGARPIQVREPGHGASCSIGRDCALQVELRGGCADGACASGEGGPIAVVAIGDARLARFATGRDDPAAAAALAQGKVVVFEPRAVRNGTATFVVHRLDRDAPDSTRRIRLPAVAVRAAPRGGATTGMRAVVPPVLGDRFGLPVTTAGYAVDPADHETTPAEQARLERAVAAIGGADVYVERGFDPPIDPGAIVLGLVGILLALGGTFIATGLAIADARSDLATLGAVGAAPRVRRLLSMGQAGFVAALGCCLGIAAGFVPGVAVTWSVHVSGIVAAPGSGVILRPLARTLSDVPWSLLGALAVLVPLVAMLAAGVVTRSRLPRAGRIGE
jgi:putative ABC transport system permease protein